MVAILYGIIMFGAGYWLRWYLDLHGRDENKEKYMKEYGRTNGLYEPTKRR